MFHSVCDVAKINPTNASTNFVTNEHLPSYIYEIINILIIQCKSMADNDVFIFNR